MRTTAMAARPEHGRRQHCGRFRRMASRREFLRGFGGGLGAVALTHLLHQESRAAPHHRPRARRVLLLFMSAGVSHVDTFDYKQPALTRHAGKTLDQVLDTDPRAITDVFFRKPGKLMPSPFRWARYGETGHWASELFPNLNRQIDKLTFVHSMVAEENSHGPAMFHFSTGQPRNGYPSMGAWAVYGLGAESQNLPAFVVLMDRGMPPASTANWGNGFLPAQYQGVVFGSDAEPIVDLKPPDGIGDAEQQATIGLVRALNAGHAGAHPGESDFAARVAAYELAARMQVAAPEAADLTRETRATHRMYGTDRSDRMFATFSRNCLLARRLLERGVRFVTVFSGGSNNVQDNWDAHADVVSNHTRNAQSVDQPIAALLVDLERRGLLDETLVIWTGEFGRTPTSEGSRGRDHNIGGFTLWMAGGGVKPGLSYGATDEFGFRAVDRPVPIVDLHATILHALGLDHEKLTYYYDGMDRRLTGVAGRVVHDLFA